MYQKDTTKSNKSIENKNNANEIIRIITYENVPYII